MTQHAPSALERIDSFESLRGLMALWVLAGHVMLTFHVPDYESLALWKILVQNGRAVYVFMMLSGFVIFYLLYSKNESYWTYIFRRFLRIYPAYIFCLLMSALMLTVSLEAVTAFASSAPRNLGRIGYISSSLEHFVPHLAMHLTMLHGVIPSSLLPNTDWAILGQAWSISVEWQFYLLAPLILSILRQESKGRCLFVLLSIVIALILIGRKLGDGFVGNHLLYFSIGCASAIYWFNTPKWNYLVGRYEYIAIPLLTLLCLILLPSRWEIAIWTHVFLSALVTRDTQSRTSVASLTCGILHWAPLRYLGKVSYSVYLVHMIPLFGTLWFIKDSNLSTITSMCITMASTIGFSIILSVLMYKWIETPFINFGKSIQVPDLVRRTVPVKDGHP